MVDFASTASAPRRPSVLSATSRWALAGFAIIVFAALLGAVAEPPVQAPDVTPAVTEWRGNSGSLAPLLAR